MIVDLILTIYLCLVLCWDIVIEKVKGRKR